LAQTRREQWIWAIRPREWRSTTPPTTPWTGAARSWSIGSDATLNIAGVLTGGDDGGLFLEKIGPGRLALAGANAYLGLTRVTSGVLAVEHPSALGATGVTNGALVVEGASLEIQGGLDTGFEALTLTGSGIGGAGALRSLHGVNVSSGEVVISGAATRVAVDAGQLTLNGVIRGAATGLGLAKAGAGALVVTASNTYSGATAIDAGTLLVNGSQPNSPVIVNDGVLGGVGKVGPITVNHGIVSPGISPGILTVNGNVAFGADSRFQVEINGVVAGGGYGQLAINGKLGLAGPTLQILTFVTVHGGNVLHHHSQQRRGARLQDQVLDVRQPSGIVGARLTSSTAQGQKIETGWLTLPKPFSGRLRSIG
jgi:autotransporter-associated beta strand protein